MYVRGSPVSAIEEHLPILPRITHDGVGTAKRLWGQFFFDSRIWEVCKQWRLKNLGMRMSVEDFNSVIKETYRVFNVSNKKKKGGRR